MTDPGMTDRPAPDVPAPTTVVEWSPPLEELTARDIMTRDPVTVGPGALLQEVADVLAEHRISALPVVDESDGLVGIVSETDLIDEEKRRVRLPRTLLFGVFPLLEDAVREAYNAGAALTAEDLMTRGVFTASEETPVRELAEEMVTRRINHVPITREGRLVGIVARADLLQALRLNWRGTGARG